MRSCVLHAAQDLRIEERKDAGLGASEVRLRVGAGGICGSDIHYYFEGRIGDFAVREPLVLGHEVAGTVIETGSAVTKISVGDRVTVNPSHPCRQCDYCRAGRENLCIAMRYLGSASVMPHVQGAFQEHFVIGEAQCVTLPDHLDDGTAAFAEPLSVALHAVRRAGDLLGKEVLVTGCGPIGALIVLVARRAGAAAIAVTDIEDAQLEVARSIGADESANAGGGLDSVAPWREAKGRFDIAIEASGAAPALELAMECTRPGGRVVQVGFMPPGAIGVQVNRLMTKELDVVGSFRFDREFDWAVDYLGRGLIDVAPLLSGQYPVAEADAAFRRAASRDGTMKVQLTFG